MIHPRRDISSKYAGHPDWAARRNDRVLLVTSDPDFLAAGQSFLESNYNLKVLWHTADPMGLMALCALPFFAAFVDGESFDGGDGWKTFQKLYPEDIGIWGDWVLWIEKQRWDSGYGPLGGPGLAFLPRDMLYHSRDVGWDADTILQWLEGAACPIRIFEGRRNQ